jgi:uncharacterized protein (DUF1684 family)
MFEAVERIDEDVHARAVARWRQAREARLRAPGGWLSLVDRIALGEGENEVPIGTILVRGGEARFRARPDLAVTCAGLPVSERLLAADEGGGAAHDVLLCEGRSYELVRREGSLAVRVKDPRSPALSRFRGLDFFPRDPRWRIVARFSPGPVLARFAIDGRPFALEGSIEGSPPRLFFAFSDETNRAESYSGGRYLYAELPVGDEVILDFNTSFNPPCAFTPFAVCPVPPARNHLPVRIPAGERRYHSEDAAVFPRSDAPSTAD